MSTRLWAVILKKECEPCTQVWQTRSHLHWLHSPGESSSLPSPLFCARHSSPDKNLWSLLLYPLPDWRLVADMGSHQSQPPLHRSSNHRGWDWSRSAHRLDLHEVGGTLKHTHKHPAPHHRKKNIDLILQRNLNSKTSRNPGHSNACGCKHRYMDGVSTLEAIFLITNAWIWNILFANRQSADVHSWLGPAMATDNITRCSYSHPADSSSGASSWDAHLAPGQREERGRAAESGKVYNWCE